jgi:methylated-DNA-[protein]-cysteine S-methyltransferase
MEKAYVRTPIGVLELKGCKNGLAAATFIDQDIAISKAIPKVLENAVSQLAEYLTNKRTSFDITLNPQGTDFQKKVWNKLAQIPFGKTLSYMDMAKQLGDPKVIRAAASANGKNPIAIIIPCHRVIGSDGSLTGYAGGLHRKKWLLEHESPITQTSLF